MKCLYQYQLLELQAIVIFIHIEYSNRTRMEGLRGIEVFAIDKQL